MLAHSFHFKSISGLSGLRDCFLQRTHRKPDVNGFKFITALTSVVSCLLATAK